MTRHRTTRATLLPLLLAAATAATVAHGAPERKRVPRLIFPVVGPSSYVDDFGDPRGSRRHEGNDIMAPRRALAVAAEAGRVKFQIGSGLAGCMLYLHGDSGTEYRYIHLNNDVTARNDNRGRCVPGVAYARGLRSGARVAAGDPVGYVGNSGDADATAPHLHFEVRPNGGAAINPFRHLRSARKLLFAARRGSLVSLTLRGRVVGGAPGSLRVRVDELRRWPGGLRVPKVRRMLELAVADGTILVDPAGALVSAARVGRRADARRSAVVHTKLAPATLAATLGAPLALTAETVVLAP